MKDPGKIHITKIDIFVNFGNFISTDFMKIDASIILKMSHGKNLLINDESTIVIEESADIRIQAIVKFLMIVFLENNPQIYPPIIKQV